jgi:anti-sigma B factor antagonist
MFDRHPSITLTSLSEPFDEDASSRTRWEFRQHVKFGRRLHVIDLDQLDSASSYVLRSLIGAVHTVRAAGGEVRLVSNRQGMRRVLTLTGLSRVFPIHSTTIDAMIAFRETPRLAG